MTPQRDVEEGRNRLKKPEQVDKARDQKDTSKINKTMYAEMADGGDEAVKKRYGEQALKTAEFQKTKEALNRAKATGERQREAIRKQDELAQARQQELLEKRNNIERQQREARETKQREQENRQRETERNTQSQNVAVKQQETKQREQATKSAQKPVEKSAEKSAQKPVEKSAEKAKNPELDAAKAKYRENKTSEKDMGRSL